MERLSVIRIQFARIIFEQDIERFYHFSVKKNIIKIYLMGETCIANYNLVMDFAKIVLKIKYTEGKKFSN